MEKSLKLHLERIGTSLDTLLEDIRPADSDTTPDVAYAAARVPGFGGMTNWQSCVGAGVSAGAAHFIGCTIDGPKGGEDPGDMIDRCRDEADVVSLVAQFRCWIGKSLDGGGGVFI